MGDLKRLRKIASKGETEDLFNLGIALINQGGDSIQEGADLLFDLAEKGHVGSIEQLTYIFLDQGEYEVVTELLSYGDEVAFPILAYLRGRSLEEQGEAKNALEVMEHAAKMGSSNAIAWLADLNGEKVLDVTHFKYLGSVSSPSRNILLIDPAYIEEFQGKTEDSSEQFSSTYVKSELEDCVAIGIQGDSSLAFAFSSENAHISVFASFYAEDESRIEFILIDFKSASTEIAELTIERYISKINLSKQGLISVSSGQALLSDLNSIYEFDNNSEDDWDLNLNKGKYSYQGASEATVNRIFGSLEEGKGFSFTTGFGDGVYEVYGVKNSKSERVAILVDFMDNFEIDES
jgi:hypothetical protein